MPTAGGVLLFGRDRLGSFPDAWMQAGSFAGIDRLQILDQLVLHGPLPEWVEQSIRFVDRHTSRAAVIDAPRRRDVPALPPVAVREAIVNAVVHADHSPPGGPLRVALFSDRLEVENPGLLPFGLTIDEIQLGVSRVRNRVLARVLARVFRELGYVEQWGSGIGRMTRACVDAGHPVPEFATREQPQRPSAPLPSARVGAVGAGGCYRVAECAPAARRSRLRPGGAVFILLGVD